MFSFSVEEEEQEEEGEEGEGEEEEERKRRSFLSFFCIDQSHEAASSLFTTVTCFSWQSCVCVCVSVCVLKNINIYL